MQSLSRSFRWSLLLFALILGACASVEPYIEGVNHAAIGEFPEAVEDYSRAIALDPYSTGDFYFSRANALRGMREFPTAINQYRLAILYGFSPAAWARYGIALSHTDLENYQEAIVSYGYYIESDDTFPPAYYNRGQLYLMQGDYAAALADFEAAIRLDPSYMAAYAALADVYYEQGEVELALQGYQQYLELNREYPAPYVFQRVIELESHDDTQ